MLLLLDIITVCGTVKSQSSVGFTDLAVCETVNSQIARETVLFALQWHDRRN